MFLIAGSPAAYGVVVYGTGNNGDGRNVGAPTGSYANSGYQYEGTLNISTASVGTAISSDAFITTAHIFGNLTGRVLAMPDGSTHTITSESLDPNTDLAVCQVSTPFTSWAPLYNGGTGNETNLDFVAYGTGKNKGAAVTSSGGQNGWYFGTADGQVSWGVGQVAAVAAESVGSQNPSFLIWGFDPSGYGGSNAGTLTDYDSGGGVFVNVSGTYELAGVNYGLAPDYSLSADGSSPFGGSIYNPTGIYDDGTSDGSWEPAQYVSTSFATEIDQSLAFVDSAAGIPEPGSFTLLGIAGGALIARRRARR